MKSPLEWYIALNWVVVILYVLATIAAAAGEIFGKARLERGGFRIAGVGLLVHSGVTVYWWGHVGHGPYMAPNEVLSSHAWAVMAGYFVFLRLYPRLRPASIVAFPSAFLLLALSMFYNPGVRTLPTTFRSVWLVVHVVIYKISLITLIIGFALAVFYLLKKKNASRAWLQRLPPLEILDSYSYRFAGFGFIFWTIGMLAGSIWAYQSWGRFWGWDLTETWSLITCLMFGTYLHLRRFFQWSGAPAAWLFIVCFTISLLTMFGIATLSSSIHSAYFR